MVPVVIIFFMWGFGTGALWVARPLFAVSLGASLFFVGLVSSLSATPRILSGLITGLLADRWGRRPMMIMGGVSHGAVLVAQFYSTSYLQFAVLEVFAGIGIAFWTVSSSVFIADLTKNENRSRTIGIRDTAMRMGMLMGPLVGGLIGETFGLRWVFIFIASTKIVVIFVILFIIPETKPARVPRPAKAQTPAQPEAARTGPRFDLDMFRNRSFAALMVATLSFGMIGLGPGVFRTYFPIHATDTVMLNPATIGYLVAAGGLITMLIAMPVGFTVDRYGRKWPLALGLALLATAVFLLGASQGLIVIAAAVSVFAVAEGMNTNTLQTYAMDLAPTNRRGFFLSVFHTAMNTGMILGPLLAGLFAGLLGLQATLVIFTGVITAGGLFFVLMARETLQRRSAVSAE